MPQTTSQLPFSIEEYAERVAKVRAGLHERDLDALLVYWPENVYYLTGYDTLGYFSYQVLVVPQEGEPFFVVRRIERQNVLDMTWLDQVDIYTDQQDPAEVTIAALRRRGLAGKRLGVEQDGFFLSIRHFRMLVDAFGTERLLDGSQLINRLRLVKSERELDYIRAAARAVAAGAEGAVKAMTVGATENDVAAAMYAAKIRVGSEYTGHASLIATGPRASRAFATWSGRTIRQGDPISLEPGACIRRYHAVIIRSLSMGEPRDPNIRRFAELSLRGLEDGLGFIKAGVTVHDVDGITKAPARRAGYGDLMTSRSGYAVGIGYPPDWGEGRTLGVREGDETLLEPNMTFHYMNNVWYEGVMAVGFSETIRVTKSGCEILTSYPRELIVL